MIGQRTVFDLDAVCRKQRLGLTAHDLAVDRRDSHRDEQHCGRLADDPVGDECALEAFAALGALEQGSDAARAAGHHAVAVGDHAGIAAAGKQFFNG